MFNAEMLLRSPLGRVLSRWLDTGPPGLEIRLETGEPHRPVPGAFGAQPLVVEIRNRGRKAATLTELGLVDARGEHQPLDSPELVLKPGATLRLRVELRDPLGGVLPDGRGAAFERGDLRAYAVDRGRRQFLSA
ncbi:MAG TPA: hypothetical protein VF282_02815 [Bacillota bacterium]